MGNRSTESRFRDEGTCMQVMWPQAHQLQSAATADAFAVDDSGDLIAVRERPVLLPFNPNEFPVYVDPKQYFVPPPRAPFGPLHRNRACQNPRIRRPPPCVFFPSERTYPREMEIVKLYNRGRQNIEHCHRLVQEMAARIPGKVNALGSRIRDALSIEKYLTPEDDDDKDSCEPFVDWDHSVIVTPLRGFKGCLDHAGRKTSPVGKRLSPTTTGDGTVAFPIVKPRLHELQCTCLPSADTSSCGATTTRGAGYASQPTQNVAYVQGPIQTAASERRSLSPRPERRQRDTSNVSRDTGNAPRNTGNVPQFTHVTPYINYVYDGRPQVRELPGFTMTAHETGFTATPDNRPNFPQDRNLNLAPDRQPSPRDQRQSFPGAPDIAVRPPTDTYEVTTSTVTQAGPDNLDTHVSVPLETPAGRSLSAPVPPVRDIPSPSGVHARSTPIIDHAGRARFEVSPWRKNQQLEFVPVPDHGAAPVMTTDNTGHTTPHEREFARDREFGRESNGSACPAFQACPVHGAAARHVDFALPHPSVQIYPIGERRTKIFSTNKKLMAGEDVKHWRRIGESGSFNVTQLPSWCPPPAPPPLNSQFLLRR
eukprot:Gregarina_sp_Poly_1__8423@NODE_495_length_7936_cov_45_131783_g398_i0_p3_GENE_NODE_495_length_7936_cov_45_131783_g398_i0NODE_495_length_7936_cov_45_131783_g398_i0_p3_ORF_typecomplete_len594_score74_09_NODE_495_length_7936_cov_45_131783_g398_i035215302